METVEDPKADINLTHFTDIPSFQLVWKKENVVLYERLYEYLPDFMPMKNMTTGEIERAYFRLQVHPELKGTKRELTIRVRRQFPGGTDYDFHKIDNPNKKPGYHPIEFDSTNEFFFEEWSGKIHRGRDSFSIQEFLDRLYMAHTRPAKKAKGFYLRNELAFLKGLPEFLTKTYYPFLVWTFRVICGKQLDLEPGSRPEWLLEKIPYNKITPDGSPTMRTYIGFECAKSTGIISLLVTLAIVMFMYFKTDLDQKGFLVVMAAMLYTLVSLFFDYLLPIMMLWLLNWMIHKSGWGAKAYVKI